VFISEVMKSLNELIVNQKVKLIGAGDIPTWVVSKGNQYGRDHGLGQFCTYWHGLEAPVWNFDIEIAAMCKEENMGLVIHGKTETGGSMGTRLGHIAQRLDVGTGETVELAYALRKYSHEILSTGCCNLEGAEFGLEGLSMELTGEEIEQIEIPLNWEIVISCNRC